MENKYKIEQMAKDISDLLLEFRNNNEENRDIDQEILIDRKYENFITDIAKKYELKGVDEIDFPINHELYKLAYSYFEKDFECQWTKEVNIWVNTLQKLPYVWQVSVVLGLER